MNASALRLVILIIPSICQLGVHGLLRKEIRKVTVKIVKNLLQIDEREKVSKNSFEILFQI
ncbi:hypothetical protein BFO01nite_40100 [Brevibacillus formosus]|uniref:Uncharacterized protein n=1 Tax=Brevibacillus formosus TaxID=54913 RepID=A0ABQ0T999_9BACL|nr:hypothetical protein BFO01nite_40100 [Brevibacillus formosus]